jgi:hypothetical protein
MSTEPERRFTPLIRKAIDQYADAWGDPIRTNIEREIERLRLTNPRGWGENVATRLEALEGHATRLWRGLEDVGSVVDRIRNNLAEAGVKDAPTDVTLELRRKGYRV